VQCSSSYYSVEFQVLPMRFFFLLFVCASMLMGCDPLPEEVVEVVHYQGPIISPDQLNTWQVEVKTDPSNVGVKRVILSNDHFLAKDTLILTDLAGRDLPLYTAFWTGDFCLRNGTIAIQDWDLSPGSVLAGEIKGRLEGCRSGLKNAMYQSTFTANIPE
jgi:hypothetical protein